MQEVQRNFGPRVHTAIQKLMRKYGNVFVTASKSGKLTKNLFNTFVKEIIKPYCRNNDFLLILDLWDGETDTVHFNSIFTDDDGNSSSMIEIIPPHCTPYCQLCDIYFFHQVKNFNKKFHNSQEIVQRRKELSTQEDAIKIHSIIHHQLSSPVFTPMIKYAQFSSKFIPERNYFHNVNQIYFPPDIKKSYCGCNKNSFTMQ